MNASENLIINNNDRVLRRVMYLDPNFIKPDGIPASSSFTLKKDSSGALEKGLSVDVERFTSPEISIKDVTKYRLFALSVEFIRQINLDCISDSVEGNSAHALIIGNISKPQARKLASHSSRLHYPD